MFKGKKIRLRAYKSNEVERVLELIEEDGLRDTLSVTAIFPQSYEAQKNFMDKNSISNGELFNFAIESLETKEYVGGCGINNLDRKNSVATVGIWIGKKYQNKGFGSDALRVLCKFIFDEMNVHKVKLHYFEFNKNAKICYESVGFKEEGINRKELFRYGKYYDTLNMGLFRDELK
ncbi:GNAT family N-acetyltransferase (plasmid) [Cetobacterium somerae]|uniref:GNAT family N-acetyltransferase n=1 Tax=Cetobacterium somerae TaxID=188913 RepID=UPI003D769F9F